MKQLGVGINMSHTSTFRSINANYCASTMGVIIFDGVDVVAYEFGNLRIARH